MSNRHARQKGKHAIDRLAIFGGPPSFDAKLHVGRPNLGNTESFLAYAKDILDRRWLTNDGPYVQKFERSIEHFLGVEHCIAMCSGTAALEIATRALGMQGEVIMPSFTFVATAHSLQWQQITPVFCDVECGTHNIDPKQIEAHITPRTSGIIGVHLWGRPCDTESLRGIADKHGLKLMFDAAHAFGCSHGGRMIGNFGELEVLSFHATKVLNTFEGGAIVTNNAGLAEKVRYMRNFGFSGEDKVDFIGTNGKMNEMSAAMGLAGLELFEKTVDHNRENHASYVKGLADLPGISVFDHADEERCNYHYIVLEVDPVEAGISRNSLVEILQRENVMARRYFYPGCHRMEPYWSYFPHAGLLLRNTERLADRVMCLPNGSALSPTEVGRVCDLVRFIVENSGAISGRAPISRQ